MKETALTAVAGTRILGEAEKSEVLALAESCDESDGTTMEVSFDTWLNAEKGMDCWFLARVGKAGAHGGDLAGILSVFAPTRSEVEIAAWTAVPSRRKGVFSVLLGAALAEARRYGYREALLLRDRASLPGKAVVDRQGAVYSHTEYAMRLDAAGIVADAEGGGRHEGEGLSLVVATQADLEELAVASMSIFGEGEGEAREHVSKAIGSESRLQFRAILGGSLIGLCCLTREDGATWITGLGILPSLRGKGLGAELLDAAIALALALWGEAAIRLEVKGDNAAALALYRSRGFVELGAIEYYRMAL